MATQGEAEVHLIQAWACFKHDKPRDAMWFAQEAANQLREAAEKGWSPDCPPKPRLKFKDWWIANPSRWFRRGKDNPSEPHTIVCESGVEPCESEDEPTTTRKVQKTVKKIIGVMALSAIVGVGSNYFVDPFSGPTQLDRGEFAAVQQCESCATIRLVEVRVCAACGETESIDRIAAPLTHRTIFMTTSHDGWQFKEGSTLFDSEGEYVVPELVVIKTMRM